MIITTEQRNEMYEQLMQKYLTEELVKNIYEKKKLLDEEFLNRDQEIAKDIDKLKNLNHEDQEMEQWQETLEQKVKEQVLELSLEMYQQGMRDMAKVLK